MTAAMAKASASGLKVGTNDVITEPGDALPPSGSRLMVPLMAVLTLTALLGAIIMIHGRELERDASSRLEITARLRAHLVEDWLSERRGDGTVMVADDDLAEHAAGFLRQPNAIDEKVIRQRLDNIREAYPAYRAAMLLNPQGEKVLSMGGQHEISAQTKSQLPKAFASGTVTQTDLYIDRDDGLISLNFIVPLRRQTASGWQAVAAVVLHTQPNEDIFPRVFAWPSSSPSGETVLVRGEGDSVIHLNALRHMKDTALKMRLPLADPLLPAAMAIRSGVAGTTRGRDYRGVDVLAAWRPVSGTDWHLVAKIDRDEVMAPLWILVEWVAFVGVAGILGMALLLRRYWLQREHLDRLATRARQLERQDIEEKLSLRGAALEAAANSIVITDAAGKIEWVNPAFCTLSGYGPDELLGHNPRDLVKSGMQATEVYQGLWRDILAGKVWRGEMTNRRKDGTHYLEDQTITPLRDKDGTIRHFISVKQNITEHRQQEEQTRLLLAQNETILNTALVGIVHLKERNILSCNLRFEELFQYAPGELIGASTQVLYDSVKTFDLLGEAAYQALASGKNYSTETLLRHKDGSLFWGAMNGRAIDPARPDDGSIWVYADISERRAAERENHKLLQAVDQCPVSILVTDKAGTIEYVNPCFTRITGFTSDEAVGRNPRILQAEDTPKETFEALWRTILDGGTWQGVLHNRCKNGELVWEDTSISPILDEAGEITHFVEVKEDVTKRIRMELQLEEHQIHLEELVVQRTAELSEALEVAKLADKAKDEFLANVTHELRTPLSAVIGFCSLARPLATDARQRDYLDKVISAGKTLAAIINDLLDLSKIVAGRMEFELAPFSLGQVVGRSRSVISYKAREKGLQLIEQIADAVPDVLVGDALRIEQILLNLLSNAVKFTKAGRVELRIGLHCLEAERVCLKIEVEDTGIGLSEDGIAQLFKPFSQADASMTRKFGGTGLGLSICKRLTEMMGGNISVTSVEGRGSTFHVRLWLGLSQSGELPATPDRGQKTVRVSYQGARVLVVDDQPFNRELVAGLLAAVGITPQLAENGLQAVDILAAAAADSFDLVLMDVQMPVMDGHTATREIHAMAGFAQLPIIAMTAHTMGHEKEKSTAAGMNDHIGKPFDEACFYGVLAKWIPASKQLVMVAATPSPAVPHGMPPLRGIDVRAGLALLQGNEVRYRQWLAIFATEMPVTMTQLKRDLVAGKTADAGIAAHTLKGRFGLLGMKELHAIAADLEVAIDTAQPSSELLLDLEHAVAVMCIEIRSGLGLDLMPGPTAAGTATATDLWPPGPPPAAVTRLIAALNAGDGDCEEISLSCLGELKDTPWAPHLQQVLVHVQNFNYAAAGRLLRAEHET